MWQTRLFNPESVSGISAARRGDHGQRLAKPIVARIQGAENHVALFTANAVAIGIAAAIAKDFQTKAEAARAALQARDLAEETLRNKNDHLRLAVIALTDARAAIVNTVHAKAELVGDSVYSLASIPVRNAMPSASGTSSTGTGTSSGTTWA